MPRSLRRLARCALLLALAACGSQSGAPAQPGTQDRSQPLSSAPVARAQGNPVAQAAPAAEQGATPNAQANAPAYAPDVNAALAYDPADPLADLEAADALDRMARGKGDDIKPPPGGCAVADGGRRIWPAPGPAAIVALARGFAIAGYAVRDGREQLFVVHVPENGLPEPVRPGVQRRMRRPRPAGR